MAQLVALGGGGFSMEPDNPLLDDFVLSLVPHPRLPRICFVPTASGDSDSYTGRFEAAFPRERAATSVLTLFERTVADLDDFLQSQDVIYVGGGNTANLLAVWRLHGLDRALRRAYRAGVVLAGVSAGMNCWFEGSITDSFNMEQYVGLPDGLGLLGGSCCPHYDGEPGRREVYHSLVRTGFPAGYAVPDSTGLHFVDEQLAEVVSSVPQRCAYLVSARDNEVIETALQARFLGI